MEVTKYEKARIIGSRALQIAMGAPILTNRENELNPIEIAKKEYEEDVLPISVRRISPKKREAKVPKKEEPKEETEEKAEEEKPAEETKEEKPGEEDKSKKA
jgi:DNA-directed RNA polymerase subunit K/omega